MIKQSLLLPESTLYRPWLDNDPAIKKDEAEEDSEDSDAEANQSRHRSVSLRTPRTLLTRTYQGTIVYENNALRQATLDKACAMLNLASESPGVTHPIKTFGRFPDQRAEIERFLADEGREVKPLMMEMIARCEPEIYMKCLKHSRNVEKDTSRALAHGRSATFKEERVDELTGITSHTNMSVLNLREVAILQGAHKDPDDFGLPSLATTAAADVSMDSTSEPSSSSSALSLGNAEVLPKSAELPHIAGTCS